MEKSYAKETENLKKSLANHLAQFEKSNEWADSSNWLIKAAQILDENKTPHIPHKEIFAKRLAQCLYPSLPSKVHGLALTTYDKIFQNLKLLKLGGDNKKYVNQLSSDLALYAIGLFPFFQFASLQIKPQFLKLIQDYITELQVQLIPCLPGLIACVLPGLEDNDESVQRQTIKLLDTVQEGVGQKYFFAALWMTILRIPRIRIGGFKYLNKKTKPFKQIEAEQIDYEFQNFEQKSEDSLYGDSKQSNSNNSLRIKKNSEYSIKDENINFTGQQSFDQEVEGEIRISYDHFQDPIAQLQVQLMKQINAIKDLKSEENFYPNKSNLIINALLSVLQDENILTRKFGLDYITSHFPIEEDILSDTDKQLLVQQCLYQFHLNEFTVMRKINIWLFGPPDNDNKFSVQDDERGIKLLKFIKKSIVNLFSLPLIDKNIPLKVLQNFYREHDHLIELTLDEIAFEMIKFMFNVKEDQNLFLSTQRLLQSISNHMDLVFKQLSLKLSEAMDQRNETNALQSIELIEFTISMQHNDISEENQIDYSQISESFQPIIQQILQTFVKIGPKTITKTTYRGPALHLVLELLKQLTNNNVSVTLSEQHKENIVKFSDYYCEYVSYILQTDDDFGILDYSSKILLSLNKIMAIHSEKQEKTLIPNWLASLISCLNSKSTRILYFSVINLYDLLENPNEFRGYISKNEETLLKILHCLYYILDEESISSSEIINKILHFKNYYSQIFYQFIQQDLKISPSLEQSIRRYSKYFRLTNDYFLENSIQNNGVGIYELLNYLQDDNPLIRYTSRSWLNDNLSYLSRIIDPLISDLLDEYKQAEYFLTNNKKVLFKNEYNQDKVQNLYKQIKSIVSILREKFVLYCFNQTISFKIQQQIASINNMVSQFDINKCSYLEIIIFLSLKLMQGQTSNSFSYQFQSKNATINANFCDFLESIMNEIQDQEILMKSITFMLENILICISNLIDQNNQVMQVQVLNLFNIILQKIKDNISNLKSDDKKLISEILTSYFCFPTLLLGLSSTKTYYVNQTYLKTINSTVFYCSQLIQPDSKSHSNLISTLTKYVEQITNTYVDLIKDTQVTNFQEESLNLTQISRIRTSNSRSLSIRQNFKLKTKNNGSIQHLDVSALFLQETTTLPASQQDQLILFDALNKLMNYFLKFKKQEVQQNTERKRLKSLFTMHSHNEKKEAQTAQFGQFQQINRNILDNLPSIIEAFLHCWPLSNSFQNYQNKLTSKGILQYKYDSFVEFNQQYQQELKNNSLNQKDSLRQKIIAIMKPIFTQFSVDTMHALFKLYTNNICNEWYNEEEYPINLYKLMDLIISLDINLVDFINVCLKSDMVLQITNFYNTRISIPKNTFPFSRQIAINEINVLSFTYIIFSIYPIDDTKMPDNYLQDIWIPANKFFQQFKSSKHSQSLVWLVESIFMMSQKFSPNQAMVDRTFRKELRRLVKGILLTLSQIAANKIQFTSVVPTAVIKSTSDAVRRLSEINDFTLIAPMSPIIYQMCLDKPDFMIFQLPKIDELKDIGDEQFILYNQIICYKVLSDLSYELLQNIYASDERITKITQNFLFDLFKAIEKKKLDNNQIIHEIYASQLINSLLKNSGQLLAKEIRKNIIELFNSQDFFNCDFQTLRNWKDIIDRISDQGDLFKEFLTKDGLFQNLVSKNHEQSHRIKKLFRVCFIIYSGNVDKYSKKLLDILEALNEIIINYEDSHQPNIYILILFCFRILVLRMSKQTLNDQFRIVWPAILTFLMKIFNDKRKKTNTSLNLVLAAIKFIELLSIVQLEEFYFYEWMFAFDFLGVKIEKIKVPSDGMSLNMSMSCVVTPFQYKQPLACYFGEPYQLDYINSINDNEIQTNFEKDQRKIIVTESCVENEGELNSKVLYLCQYLIDINHKRLSIDNELLEQVIEQDFIELNKIFFEIK
ncbi:dopey, amine-terminal domain protein (macronuclear) [Tetrahymena thermophila SB210]|uniref:Dopey, amine-terminal domain protein n=1 Tax=Tetrahymena thermophila (strain SB210) TaxID=312017 RepID=I7MDW0_TETTS|nr:dopey, amine-terminal domain protein [Tetrahymena thermophila SB210]EAR92823.2 dopey, amine-terminal domain protein [Tetrahymena thermophila SB210]|eukprot:XP_001013068.2 dopey, amine-terminal domain protein [Tetrahymena thermophila SB210]